MRNSTYKEIDQAWKLIDDGKDEEALKLALKFGGKAYSYFIKADYDKAIDMALQNKELYERIGKKIHIAGNLGFLGHLYLQKGDHEAGLNCGMKSLAIQEELKNQAGIAAGLYLIGLAYNFKGNFNQAIEFCKRSLAIKEIESQTEANALSCLGIIYNMKGDLYKANRYFEKCIAIGEKLNNPYLLALNLSFLGGNHALKGEYDSARKYYEHSLEISEKIGYSFSTGLSLYNMIFSIDIPTNSMKEAEIKLERLRKLYEQKKGSKFRYHIYSLSKAYILSKSGRSRDRAEAEQLLKQAIEDRISNPTISISAVNFLCAFLIQELINSNDLTILDEIFPLITRLENIAEKTHSYIYLSIAKAIQSVLALIQMNFKRAKQLITEAQRIAEFHTIEAFARIFSAYNDRLVEQQEMWEDLEKRNVPISERIDLINLDPTFNLLLQNRLPEPPKLISEQPVLLVIIEEGGVPLFSYSFSDEWNRDDVLFSSFLSAFSSFSDEFFSEGLDRVRFGQHTVLLETISFFSVCYLYKGQTYPAKQKLTQFIEALQNRQSIWQALEKFSKTSQVLENRDIPQLKSLITEIFITENLLPHQSN